MPSTYSTDLRLELIADGEQSGLWGQTTNKNLGTLLEQAIAGVINITVAGATHTLTALSGLSDESRNAVLVFSGSPGATCVVTAPSVDKLYVVRNNLSGGFSLQIKTATGTAVTVRNGTIQFVYCNGTDFFTLTNVNEGGTVNGNLTVTGNQTVGGTFGVTGNTTLTGDLAVNGNSTVGNASSDTLTINGTVVNIPNNLQYVGTGAVAVPVGTTAQRPGTPLKGYIRYNDTLVQFEGYNGTLWGQIGGGATGGGTDRIFYLNGQTITQNYTVSATDNAGSFGPVTIADGVTVTVADGATWTIV